MLDGFEVVPGNNAGSFIGDPWRVVLHTTEGSTADGAIGAYRTNNSWPHFTVDVQRRRKIQHLELDVAARALLHPPASPETNRANAIQIELVGFATETPGWAKPDLAWLATDVLAPIRAVCPFALVAERFVAYPQSAGTGAAQRFTDAQWSTFSGICGHEHVPRNDHGDPGLIDTTTILAALGGADPGDDDMAFTDQQARDLVAACSQTNDKMQTLLNAFADDKQGVLHRLSQLEAETAAIKTKLGA